MEFFLQIRIPADHPVQRLVFPDPAGVAFEPVDLVRGERLDRMQNFRKRPEHRLAFLVLLLDLGLKKEVNMIRHDAGRIELIATLLMSEEQALQDNVPRRRRKLAALMG